jgi:large exoprotein involved in heme utilization and adhesion
VALEATGDLTIAGSVDTSAEGFFFDPIQPNLLAAVGDVDISGLVEARDLLVNSAQLVVSGKVEVGGELLGGGFLEIQVGEGLRVRDGTLSASAPREFGGGGSITVSAGTSAAGPGSGERLPTRFVVLEGQSRIEARAIEGGGGTIRIVSNAFFASPESVISAASQFGPQGTVEINAPDTDLASQITNLPGSFLDASSQLQPHCAARGGSFGSFTTSGRGGNPASPDGFLSASVGQPAGPREQMLTRAFAP